MLLLLMFASTALGLLGVGIEPREVSSNKTVCGSEVSASGLKTNYFCEGAKPVCCRDSTTSLEEGIPWACIPAEGVCCGHGDYCSTEIHDLYCVRSGAGQGYRCRGAGLDLPSLVGATPELEFDRSGVEGEGGQQGDSASVPTLGLRTSTRRAWGLGFVLAFLL